ncbi:PREDICTED: cyclin-dependent kinase G-2 isoform X1 [Theobroma cacao]|uniref:cyclin-dependent kinase n=1 Tax=Theobroma cacao TaxID=3641 RepID=A0AB32VYE4_THECC|nr:PREDICTED: cyclin-dependent kinase G-2 isoform X1 [Theobroma cacao]XP_017970960.1 PREDICTED: cyclin-dependent kinase G-2 isoform X1 [Theobroma cacao]
MAAGRHGGYRDNEIRDRDSDFEVTRREFAISKEFEPSRNGSRDNERGRVREARDRDRARVRQKDIKEREVINGGYRSSSSRSDSGASSGGDGGSRGPRRCEFSLRVVDKEPGELSSESGSEDAIESESGVKGSEVEEVMENGARSPAGRKRKFSPIVWDRDDKDLSNLSKSRNSPAFIALPPPPPLPKVYRKSPSSIPGGAVQISPVRDSKSQKSQSPSPVAAAETGGYSAQPSPVDLDLSLPKEPGNDLDTEQLEDEDYVPTRHISSSRWAAGDSSPGDEGEIVEDEEMPKRRKKLPLSESSHNRVRNKSVTPELGELKRESSEGIRVRSSESDERGAHSKSGSGDDYPGNDSEKDDYMDIDNEHDRNDSSVSQSDTDSENENDSRGTPEPPAPLLRSVNMLQGCRSVDEFERLNKIDEGTYGVVYRARDKKTGEIVALKKVKMEKEREGFPLTSLREINILLSFHHPSIVDVKEVVVGSNLDSIFMVMEYMEHDLKGLMETMKQAFSQSEVKCLMLQLLEGVKYLHDNWVLHRDLKTSNLLLNNQGELKICDFGLARQYGSPLKPYTHLVVTLWYRAPELLLGARQYSTAIDMWSLGCIMAELLSKEPLFNGKTEFDQLDKIFRILGTPNETIWPDFSKLPGVKVNFVKHQYNLLRKKFPATSFTGTPVLSDAGFDLLNKLLTYDPEKRITAEAALNHEWFREVPLPKTKAFMPTFPAQHAQDRRMRRMLKSPDPLEEQRRKELQQGELGTGGLFG